MIELKIKIEEADTDAVICALQALNLDPERIKPVTCDNCQEDAEIRLCMECDKMEREEIMREAKETEYLAGHDDGYAEAEEEAEDQAEAEVNRAFIFAEAAKMQALNL